MHNFSSLKAIDLEKSRSHYTTVCKETGVFFTYVHRDTGSHHRVVTVSHQQHIYLFLVQFTYAPDCCKRLFYEHRAGTMPARTVE